MTTLHKSSQPLGSYPYMLSSGDQEAITLVGLNLVALEFQQLFLEPLDSQHLPQETQPDDIPRVSRRHTGTCFTFHPEEQLIPGFQGSGHHSTEWERE